MPTYLEQTGAEVQEILNRPEIKRNSQLINDEGYINREEDPTVPSWSKQPNKPTYTAEEVGAMPSDAAFKTINGESVKGNGNINTDAIEIQNSPRLVATGDVFDEYFGASAYDLLKRGICGFSGDSEEDFKYIYYKVSGTYPLEDLGDGPTVVFDDGITRSTITTRDEDGTIYIDALSEESSKVELQQSLTPGSTTKAPSVTAVKNRIEPIEAKIPAEASSSNKLADKAYVDGKVAVVDEKVGDIEDIIPDQASPLNKLADKNYVHSEVQQYAADYRGIYVNLRQIPTDTRYYPADDEGNEIPNRNDFLVVAEVDVSVYQWVSGRSYAVGDIVYDYDNEKCMFICKSAVSSNTHPEQDEDHWDLWFHCDLSVDGSIIEGSWLFTYTGSWETKGILGWLPRFQLNETPFTDYQWAAINSGMNTAKRQKLDALPTNAELQQSLEDLTPLVLTYGTSYGEETYNALEAIATGRINRKAFIKQGNNIYPASVEDYGAVYAVQAVELNEPDLSGAYKLSCVIAPDGADGYDTDWTRENAETPEVFWATYGTTTATDIMTAYNAGKICACAYSNKVYTLTTFNASSITFSLTDSKNYRVLSVDRTTDAWQNYLGVLFEDSSNRKSTIIGNEASTTYYPNCKAVADYVEAKKEVFVATYGTTTAAEILTASQAGKAVFADYNGILYSLVRINTLPYRFEAVNINTFSYVSVDGDNNWGISSINAETTNRLTTSLSSSSTDTQYPSAKCVYDAIFGAMSNSY